MRRTGIAIAVVTGMLLVSGCAQFDGVCFDPLRNCDVLWDAVGAIATLLATLLALSFGVQPILSARADRQRRARLLGWHLQAEMILALTTARTLANFDDAALSTMSISDEEVAKFSDYAAQAQLPLARAEIYNLSLFPGDVGPRIASVMGLVDVVRGYAQRAVGQPVEARLESYKRARKAARDVVEQLEYCTKEIAKVVNFQKAPSGTKSSGKAGNSGPS